MRETISSTPAENKTERSPRATHCTNRAQTSKAVTGRPFGVDALGVLAKRARTKSSDRKQTENKYHKYTYSKYIHVERRHLALPRLPSPSTTNQTTITRGGGTEFRGEQRAKCAASGFKKKQKSSLHTILIHAFQTSAATTFPPQVRAT